MLSAAGLLIVRHRVMNQRLSYGKGRMEHVVGDVIVSIE